MKIAELEQLRKLVDARYQVRQQAFRSLLTRENTLRNELIKLSEQKRASEKNGELQMRAIGADVIWNAWLEKAKISLNMQLALVLAEKEQHVRQVRQAFGKVMAADELLDDQLSSLQRSKNESRLEQAISQTVFK
ncbi:hypothetical protein [uncultured Roseobacter sp.]|uniref:hypothetical protein n=1 Tax=uncultured Roseobacter sp. TaxID=114847 RepID=UPI00262613DB|nr:hypothetical protein [uncultured Roseobacter sp.]